MISLERIIPSFEEPMGDGPILSEEDLMNEHSIHLIKDFNVNFSDIPEDYFEVLEFKKNNPNLKIEADNQDPINFYYLLAKKFASSSILHYELITREAISFVQSEGLVFFEDVFGPDFHFREATRDYHTAYDLRKRHFNYLNSLRN
ncbi:hypothetical protein J4411_01255 [Candidatus Pacearchaeota archaeon]|nr:hypothetical protein [uncultured archaeon]MBS3084521.1 hypothetical protein [Candidatus Pacearchaeota archaeon]